MCRQFWKSQLQILVPDKLNSKLLHLFFDLRADECVEFMFEAVERGDRDQGFSGITVRQFGQQFQDVWLIYAGVLQQAKGDLRMFDAALAASGSRARLESHS